MTDVLTGLADRLDSAATADDPWTRRIRAWRCDRVGCDGRPHEGWPERHGRAGQMPPPESDPSWLVWFFMAGRGTGKTRSGAEAVSEWCRHHPGLGVALVGERLQDVRRTMVEGRSGLLSVLPPEALRGGEQAKAFNRGEVTLYLANGCWLQGYSSEVPDGLRGPEHGLAWVDEPAKLADAHKGITTDVADSTTWNNLMFGLRGGAQPRVLVTGTPKRVRLVRDILALATTRVTQGSTFDNLENLAPSFVTEVIEPYRGTRMERQEIGGQLIDEVEGALVPGALLDATRVDPAALPDMAAVVIGVDPPGGRTECGIVAVGRGLDGHGYVLADASGRMGAEEWPLAVVALATELRADEIVGERNYGGDMVKTLVAQAAKALYERGELASPYTGYRDAHATRGKAVRAQPVGLLFDQRRFHLAGSFPELEDELTTWTENDDQSPNRLDALVWGAHASVLGSTGPARVGGRLAAATTIGPVR